MCDNEVLCLHTNEAPPPEMHLVGYVSNGTLVKSYSVLSIKYCKIFQELIIIFLGIFYLGLLKM